MYNPHTRPDYADEAALMSKGRLIKARLVDQDIPNVDWFWVQTGNCFACKYFAAAGANLLHPKCLNKKISHSDFMGLYTYVNTCPEFEHGTSEQSDTLDVMRAAGIVEGEPSQEVEIIVDEPWSMTLAERAHREQSYFLDMAAQADAGGDNSPSRGEYVDMTDDLERESGTDAELSHDDQPRDESGRWTDQSTAVGRFASLSALRTEAEKHGTTEAAEYLWQAALGVLEGATVPELREHYKKLGGLRTPKNRAELLAEIRRRVLEVPLARDSIQFSYDPTKPRDEAGRWTSGSGKKKVAILGLAANPPHAGHLALARHVRDTGGFDEVWLMPANKHVFKPDMVEPEHRLAMTRAMLEGEPGIEVADTEVRHDLSGPTIDTVKKLNEEHGSTHDFSWVISQDEANSFKHWIRSDELREKIPFVVAPRPGVEATPDADWSKEPPHRILEGGADLVDVSSTKLRELLADEQDTAEFLHPSVAEYIRRHGLYKSKAALSVDTTGHEHKGKGEGGGQFTSKGKGETTVSKPKLSSEEKKKASDEHFEKLMSTKKPEDAKAFRTARAEGVAIPPAWTDVVYYGAAGTDKGIVAEGRDDKGRKQRAENPEYREKVSAENNARITKDLKPRMGELRKQLHDDAEAGNEEAKVLYLISLSGFRIGGEGTGKAKEKAYGASNLQGQHVKVNGDMVTFDFPGKKGVRQQHTIKSQVVADMMQDAQPGKPVFSTRDTKVRDAWQIKYGGEKVHDIRHVVAYEIAERELHKRIPPPPNSDKQRNTLIKEVATVAAKTLGNDPAQTLGTYIDPHLWDQIQVAT